jgi:plasmid maintenance system antidote protein VapI
VEHDQEDVTLGFEGFPRHMNANVLTSVFGISEERTVNQFVSDLLSDQCIILVSRIGGTIRDVWITADPQSDLRHKSNDEVLEFRYWSARQRKALATTPDQLV